MKQSFSEPKIYTGGIDASQWSRLKKPEQKTALEKDWYVYYSFRSPETGKLERQPNIKAGANRFRTKRERYGHLQVLQRNLLRLLEMGFDPYGDNSQLIKNHFEEGTSKKPKKKKKVKRTAPKKVVGEGTITDTETLSEALDFGLAYKKNTLNENSYPKFRSRINRFRKWLVEQDLIDTPVEKINKKTVNDYLNHVLKNSSGRNRNNTRTDLGSLFQLWEDNEKIPLNFIKSISKLKTTPIRNKTYTPELLEKIEEHLKNNDPILLLFTKFISYSFLRPIEVCRLRIKDIDIKDKKLYVRTKNKPEKIKIIPEILISELPDLSNINPNYSLFTPQGIGGEWNTSEDNKRVYFTNRFKKVKDFLQLDKNHALYSYRHTYITKLYRKLREDNAPNVAKGILMNITGHTTITALDKYLRDIDAELPEDYSHLYQQ
ncbi:integrase [Saonia flava]|uniref:Integrase n=1 Tax=Saonia flava TaxID=523696 RepID=A0A846QVD7_9FLAO|nr:site-specific integrase [Saonia flava]NJB72886.1 integrase [Saonia flava]